MKLTRCMERIRFIIGLNISVYLMMDAFEGLVCGGRRRGRSGYKIDDIQMERRKSEKCGGIQCEEKTCLMAEQH